jgi:tryptophan 2,3-dioxygenase
MPHKYTSVHYNDYLKLDDILSSQKLRSEAVGTPAHDEMLFIIVHQAYELWFKQIIHELTAIRNDFMTDAIDERSIFQAVGRLDRVIKIQSLLIDQISVLETMTPLDFLDFRSYLFPASGFQSLQFRKIEILLGLKEEQRMTYNKKPYHTVFDEDKKQELFDIQDQGTLIDWVEKWLERTPFLKFRGFNFIEQFKKSVEAMHKKELKEIRESEYLEEESRNNRIQMIEKTQEYFNKILDPKVHEELRDKGEWTLSYEATIAALLIRLYQEEPILHMPQLLLTRLMDIDEIFTNWRYRHAQMVLRMLGRKTGTGGSSGHEYLKETAHQHQIYTDLHQISTLLIPRSELPPLPEDLKKELGFFFTIQSSAS